MAFFSIPVRTVTFGYKLSPMNREISAQEWWIAVRTVIPAVIRCAYPEKIWLFLLKPVLGSNTPRTPNTITDYLPANTATYTQEFASDIKKG